MPLTQTINKVRMIIAHRTYNITHQLLKVTRGIIIYFTLTCLTGNTGKVEHTLIATSKRFTFVVQAKKMDIIHRKTMLTS